MVSWKDGAPELVGTKEIAERLGLSYPESVHTWRRRYSDFPEPIGRLSGVFVWLWSDVEAWAQSTGREVKKPRARKGKA